MKKILYGFIFLAFSQASLANNSLQIQDATVRSPIPGMANTAGYMKLKNTTNADIVLTHAMSDVAQKVEYLNHIMESGVMKMVKLDQLLIPAGQSVTFQSGGLHLMFLGLTKKQNFPSKVPVKLIDKSGAEYPVAMDVKSIKMQHHHHH